MRRDDDDAARRRERAQQPDHAVDLHVIERRGRLVRDDQRWIERERAGDRHALLLAARELARPVVHAILEADHHQELFGTRPRGLASDAGVTHPDIDVLLRREARDEVERLEHHAHRPAPVGRDVRPL